MSTQDKARVKEAIAAYLANPETPRLTPSAVALVVNQRTGLTFGPTTIARFMKDCGWRRVEPSGPGPVLYERPSA